MCHVGATRFRHAHRPFFFYLINADDVVHGDKRSAHAGELGFQLFFGWVNNHAGLFAKHVLLNFYEAIHVALVNLPYIQLIYLILVEEHDFVERLLLGHCAGRVKQGVPTGYQSRLDCIIADSPSSLIFVTFLGL